MEYELALLEKNGTHAALFCEEKLCEYYPPSEEKAQSGDIYLAKVERIVPGLDAAFVDLGGEKGFIYAKEVVTVQNTSQALDIKSLLKVGQEIMVQVIKEALGDKRPTLTMKISMPGEFIVFLPNTNQRSVSRKIDDEKLRETLQSQLAQMNLASDTGVILRTNAAETDLNAWQNDYDRLLVLWQGLAKKPNSRLIYKATDIAETLLRDVGKDLKMIWTDSAEIYERLRKQTSISVFLREQEFILQKFALESQLKAAWQKKVPLKSGGYLIIEQTEAMVVIDVNSGNFAAKSGTEETFVKLNIEAAEEVARQIRLRNLGGIIIVDFVDMKNPKSREKVELYLNEAVRKDRLKVHPEGWSALGLFELTRQKKGLPLAKYIAADCACCHGADASFVWPF